MPYHNKARLAISFSNWLLFTFLACLLFSCRRNKDSGVSTYEGFFISTFDLTFNVNEAQEEIYYTDGNHNLGVAGPGGYLINFKGSKIVDTKYNWRKHALYFTKPDDTYSSTRQWTFKYFNVDAGVTTDMGNVRLIDNYMTATFGTLLICNTSADILYFARGTNDSSVLYEISRNGVLNPREILGTDSSLSFNYPVVDESSGNIFFINKHALMKIDPATAQITTVATYTDVDPIELLFNNNDKMFYALDNLHKYRFLRIDPASGALTVLSSIATGPNRPASLMLDRCNNQCIFAQKDSTLLGGENAYWLDLKDGKVDTSSLHIWAEDHIEYINEKFPTNYPH
jgi:hypothetical protein